jgi:hypothetical protein
MRTFLERNRIYFETLGQFGPGLVATIIAFWALAIAVDTRDVTLRQAEAGEKSARPLITGSMLPRFDDSLRVVGSEVHFVNYGGLARDLEMAVYEFISIECGKNGRGVWQEHIPVRGYYQFAFLTGNPSDTIARLVPLENFQKMGQLYFSAISAQVMEGYAAPSFLSVVRFSYETPTGQKVVEFFHASPHSGVARMPQEKATTLIGQHSGADDRLQVEDFHKIRTADVLTGCSLTRVR